jgi:hypothetical protein
VSRAENARAAHTGGANATRALLWGTALALLWLQPVALGWADPWTLVLPLVGAAAAYGLSRLEDLEGRRRFLELWALGIGLKWAALIAMVAAQRHVGAVLLGPDGALYLARSVELAAAGLVLPESPIAHYGTHDVGPYYLFAAVITLFGDSLLTLQTFNATLSALIAPLTYSWVRLIAPRHALAVGLVLAVYPTATLLAVADLLKDPAVSFATVFAVWGSVHLLHGRSTSVARVAMFTVAVMAALVFLHVSRFYTLFFLLTGIVFAVVVRKLRRMDYPVSARGLAAMSAAFLVAELAFVPLGWPTSAGQMWRTTRTVLGTGTDGQQATRPDRADVVSHAVRVREEQLPTLDASLRFAQQMAHPPSVFTDAAPGSEAARWDGMSASARALRVETEEYRSLPPSAGFQGRLTELARKTLGPYVWILPPDYSVRTLLAGDYILYPGMLFWYVLWPCMCIGLAHAGWQFVRGRVPLMVGALTVFTSAYLALYLVINLSYRQRDAIFPFLLVFAVMGIDIVTRRRVLLWAYAGYWVALVALAAAHLLVRTRLP